MPAIRSHIFLGIMCYIEETSSSACVSVIVLLGHNCWPAMGCRSLAVWSQPEQLTQDGYRCIPDGETSVLSIKGRFAEDIDS